MPEHTEPPTKTSDRKRLRELEDILERVKAASVKPGVEVKDVKPVLEEFRRVAKHEPGASSA